MNELFMVMMIMLGKNAGLPYIICIFVCMYIYVKGFDE
jgi:hypothetical protein